jgi:hypothetical protein
MSGIKEIIAIIGPLGPFVVSLLVAYVAYQQWKTASNKLKLDLYEKRLKIFNDAHALYLSLLDQKGENDQSKHSAKVELRQFTKSYRSAQFLFNKKDKIVDLLNEFHVVAIRMNAINIEDVELGLPRNKWMDDVKWMNGKILILEEKMAKYLRFKK